MHFVRAAYRNGLIRRGQLARWMREGLAFRLRGSTDESTEQALRAARESLTGVPESDIARMAPDVLAGVLPRIYPQMLDEIRAHQDAGRATFIVSAAAHGLVEMLATVLDMEGGIGTRYEADEHGILTGRLDGPFVYGEGKVEAMRGFAADHGLDLAESWAYSDSASDLPMLRAAAYPVAVNPDAELAAVAKQEGWQVMRFDRLRRRLAIAGTTVAAAAIGGMGTLLASRGRTSGGTRLQRARRLSGGRVRRSGRV